MRNNAQSGFTLIELMMAIVLGMIVILAMAGLVIAGKLMHDAQIDNSAMQDTARNAFDNIARSIKQAGYVSYDDPGTTLMLADDLTPAITGLDASTLKASTYGIDAPLKSATNSSDILAIRFAGSGSGATIDSSMNCAGFGVPASADPATADEDRGWSIYYVAKDSYGAPNLYCKYRGKGGSFTAQSIAEGVESFQVLYGIDTSAPANGIANQFISASAINSLDAALPASERAKRTHWKTITAVKVALLLHGAINSNSIKASTSYNLFGAGYANASDKGTTIIETELATSGSTTTKKIYSTTIHLRNPLN